MLKVKEEYGRFVLIEAKKLDPFEKNVKKTQSFMNSLGKSYKNKDDGAIMNVTALITKACVDVLRSIKFDDSEKDSDINKLDKAVSLYDKILVNYEKSSDAEKDAKSIYNFLMAASKDFEGYQIYKLIKHTVLYYLHQTITIHLKDWEIAKEPNHIIAKVGTRY